MSLEKAPGDNSIFAVDWSALLQKEPVPNATILSSTWTVVTGTVSIVDSYVSGSLAMVRLSGGVGGETSELLNHITTSHAPDGFDFTAFVKVRKRQ